MLELRPLALRGGRVGDAGGAFIAVFRCGRAVLRCPPMVPVVNPLPFPAAPAPTAAPAATAAKQTPTLARAQAEKAAAPPDAALTADAAATPIVPEPPSDHPRLRGATALVAAPLFAAPQVA